MSGDPKTIPEVIHELAGSLHRTLTEFEVKAYLKVAYRYDFGLVLRAAFKYVDNEDFLSVSKFSKTLRQLKEHEYHESLRNRPQIPEVPVSEEQLRWNRVMAKSLAGWMRSGIIKRQKDAGTFYSYEQSTIDYMNEQGVAKADIKRFWNACQDVKPSLSDMRRLSTERRG